MCVLQTKRTIPLVGDLVRLKEDLGVHDKKGSEQLIIEMGEQQDYGIGTISGGCSWWAGRDSLESLLRQPSNYSIWITKKMIDTNTIEGKIAVMQAFADGKKIEKFGELDPDFVLDSNPLWDWSAEDYRIYEEAVIKDEIPWHIVDSKYRYHAFDINGSGYFYTDEPPLINTAWGLKDVTSFASSRALKIKRGNQPWDKSLVKRPE